MKNNTILLTCARGITPYLVKECEALDITVDDESPAGVFTSGTIKDAMRMNLWLRSAHRVLLMLSEFEAPDADALYAEVIKIPWEDYIDVDGYVSINSAVDNPTITDNRFASLRCKDAIVDRMQEKFGRRPDSGKESDKTVVSLYWKDSRCIVYLDTSGEPLSKRGYKKVTTKAPMQETLAASVVAATGWGVDKKGSFVNPMCGSGTLAIEAALIALGRAPGAMKLNFGFMHIKGYDSDYWKQLRSEARQSSKKDIEGQIIATDSDPRAVEAARSNAKTAGVEHLIDFKVCDFRDTELPEDDGVIIMNPEYGQRMGDTTELEVIYMSIGDFFKQKCAGYTGYVFTGETVLAKKIGLRTSARKIFFNGPIECRLLKYDLYKGSR
jgi:23S rRNA G2445 N2-methylase RlmL